MWVHADRRMCVCVCLLFFFSVCETRTDEMFERGETS
jgi:hypothetical protein